MSPAEHPLFRRYPLDGHAQLSVGTVPTPYHVYDGHGLFFGGTADLAAVRALLEPEQVFAVPTDSGRALMGVWVFDFTAASLGAHHELQCSLFVSPTEVAPVPAGRLELINLMLTRPDVQMLCHGLWNSTARAVAYNRELLALDARASESRIDLVADAIRFSIKDQASKAPVVEGCVHRPRRPSLSANLALLVRLGLRRLMALARQPWIRMPVVNPVGARLQCNAAAESFTKPATNVLRYFDPARDRLVFGANRYRELDFQPQFFQFMDGFKFVYLFPR